MDRQTKHSIEVFASLADDYGGCRSFKFLRKEVRSKMAVEVMQCGEREFFSVLKVRKGNCQILVSSRAVGSFIAARFAAGELYQRLAGMTATQKTDSPKAGKALRAAV